MFAKLLVIFTVIIVPFASHAQEKEKPTPVMIRAVLHDPVKPHAELFYPDPSGALNQIIFRPQDLTEPMLMLPVNGMLVLHDKANIDPENPAASLAASVTLPPDTKRAIIIVLPAPANAKPAYRMVVLDDSAKAFPPGESRALSLIKVETAMQAGEHRLAIHPGKFTAVPRVQKVNAFNMAQTNFYYQQEGSWIAFAERQLQFLNATRRIFIIHATPGALQPTISTIVDTVVAAPPP
jgi:hypothetical protein